MLEFLPSYCGTGISYEIAKRFAGNDQLLSVLRNKIDCSVVMHATQPTLTIFLQLLERVKESSLFHFSRSTYGIWRNFNEPDLL